MPGLQDTPGVITVRVQLPVAMGSATTDDEYPGFVAPTNATIVGARFIPLAAVTANATNFSTLNVRNRTTGAGAALPVARSWVATNSVAFVPDTMVLSGTAADYAVAKGDSITVSRVHTLTGVVIPAGTVEIDYVIR